MRKFVTSSALVLLMGAIPALAQTGQSEDKRAPQVQQNRTQQNPSQENPSQQNPSTQVTPADQRPKSQENQTKTQQAPNDAKTQSQQPTRKDETQSQGPADKSTPSGAKSDTNTNEQQTKAAVNLTDQQRTQISAAISSQRVQPLTNVNFSISVGTTIPRTVRLHTLPSNIVAIVPQYRGYSYVVVREEIIIVEPRTYRIVAVLPYSGGQAAATTNRRSVKFTTEQRQRIRAAAQRRQVVRSQFIVGRPVSAEIELHEFPDTLYTEFPGAREYRYVTGPRGIVVVEPRDRTVIDVIE